MRAAFWHWLVQVFIAFDQAANAVLLGWADETLSSRSWRLWVRRKPAGLLFRPLIDVAFVWQRWDLNHCQRAYEHELQRYNFPLSMRAPEDRNVV